MLVSAPSEYFFPHELWARVVGWMSDFTAIVAIAVGVGGSIAMGMFQVADGVDVMLGGEKAAPWLVSTVLAVACLPPLLVDLGAGMARQSNLAMSIAIGLIAYVIILRPIEYLMNAILSSFGEYVTVALP